MKKILTILLCTVMTLSIVACGADKQDKQALDNKMDLTDTNALSGDNDMIVGSWFCDEVQEELDFTDSAMVTVTTPMVNDSGSYKLEDGKLIMKFDIGDDIYDYELSDSALILKNSDGVYTFIRVAAGFDMGNAFSTEGEANSLSVIVYEPDDAGIADDTKTIADDTKTDETSMANAFDISKIAGHYFNTLSNQNKPDELVVEEAFGGPSYHFAIFAAYEYMTISSGGAYDYTAGFNPSEVSSSADGSWKISLPTNGGYEADFTINSDGSIDVLVTGFSTTYNGHFVKD